MRDDPSKQNDSTNSKAQSDTNTGRQKQPNYQTNPAKPANDSAQQQDMTDAEKLREVRAELLQIRGNRHDSLRR